MKNYEELTIELINYYKKKYLIFYIKWRIFDTLIVFIYRI